MSREIAIMVSPFVAGPSDLDVFPVHERLACTGFFKWLPKLAVRFCVAGCHGYCHLLKNAALSGGKASMVRKNNLVKARVRLPCLWKRSMFRSDSRTAWNP